MRKFLSVLMVVLFTVAMCGTAMAAADLQIMGGAGGAGKNTGDGGGGYGGYVGVDEENNNTANKNGGDGIFDSVTYGEYGTAVVGGGGGGGGHGKNANTEGGTGGPGFGEGVTVGDDGGPGEENDVGGAGGDGGPKDSSGEYLGGDGGDGGGNSEYAGGGGGGNAEFTLGKNLTVDNLLVQGGNGGEDGSSSKGGGGGDATLVVNSGSTLTVEGNLEVKGGAGGSGAGKGGVVGVDVKGALKLTGTNRTFKLDKMGTDKINLYIKELDLSNSGLINLDLGGAIGDSVEINKIILDGCTGFYISNGMIKNNTIGTLEVKTGMGVIDPGVNLKFTKVDLGGQLAMANDSDLRFDTLYVMGKNAVLSSFNGLKVTDDRTLIFNIANVKNKDNMLMVGFGEVSFTGGKLEFDGTAALSLGDMVGLIMVTNDAELIGEESVVNPARYYKGYTFEIGVLEMKDDSGSVYAKVLGLKVTGVPQSSDDGGGCNAEFGFLALALLGSVPFVLRKNS